MTTVINTPSAADNSDGGGAGWAVAVIILLAVIGAGVYYWTSYRGAPASEGIDVKVTLPENPITNPTP